MNDTIFYRRDVTSLDAILANPDLPDDLRGRVGHIDDWLMSTTNDVEASHAAVESARQDEEAAKTDLARAEQQSVLPNSTVTEAQLKVLRDRVERAKERTEAERAKHRENIAIRTAAEEVQSAVRRLLEGARTYEPSLARPDGEAVEISEPGSKLVGFDLRFHPVTVPVKGDPHQVLQAARAEVSKLTADLAEAESAPPRPETVKRLLRADVESAARRGALSFDAGGDRSGPSISWPTVAIPAAPLRSEGPNRVRVIDVEAVLCKLHGDKIIEEIEAAVDAAYAGTEVVRDPHEKAREVRRIRAAILEAERLECAAIWKLHEQGEPLDFRADTSPKAVLALA